jgi:hypothetical protein
VITEQEYRRLSNDRSSRWLSSGDNIGIQEIANDVAGEIEDYLDTFLEPKAVNNEAHRVYFRVTSDMGAVASARYRVNLNKCRVLTNYDITVTWVHHALCSCTQTTCSGCANVLDANLGVLDLSTCTSTSASCGCFTTYDYLTCRISYTAGFTSIPRRIKRAIAILARHDAKELIVGDAALDDDLPWGAPQNQRSDLGLFRGFDTPKKYAASEQGISYFGRGFVGIEAERLCARYKFYGVNQF